MKELAGKYGEVVHLKMGPYHVLCLNSLSAIKETFASDNFAGRQNFLTLFKLITKKKGVYLQLCIIHFLQQALF